VHFLSLSKSLSEGYLGSWVRVESNC